MGGVSLAVGQPLPYSADFLSGTALTTKMKMRMAVTAVEVTMMFESEHVPVGRAGSGRSAVRFRGPGQSGMASWLPGGGNGVHV